MCQTWITLNADEDGQHEGAAHLHVLRADQHVPAVHAVGDHAADQREQEDRDIAEERIEPEQKGRLARSRRPASLGHFCIHVPMLEVQAPIHMRRKSRY